MSRYVYQVSVKRDGVPGWNYNPEDILDWLRAQMNLIPHYDPEVLFITEIKDDGELEPNQELELNVLTNAIAYSIFMEGGGDVTDHELELARNAAERALKHLNQLKKYRDEYQRTLEDQGEFSNVDTEEIPTKLLREIYGFLSLIVFGNTFAGVIIRDHARDLLPQVEYFAKRHV